LQPTDGSLANTYPSELELLLALDELSTPDELDADSEEELCGGVSEELDSGATAELDNSLELLSFASDDESGFADGDIGNCGFESEQLAQKSEATVKLNKRINLWIVMPTPS
jgi:hypothetical protein